MKPLIVLLAVFVIALAATRLAFGETMFGFSGRAAMAGMLLFTAIGHFAFTKGMAMMIPEQFPYKVALVYISGIYEIVAAIGLLIPQLQVVTGWTLVIFFLAALPSNINAAMKNVDYQKGTFDGTGPSYLAFRIPLQIFFMVWVYYFTII